VAYTLYHTQHKRRRRVGVARFCHSVEIGREER
jgi:hypothetical protein